MSTQPLGAGGEPAPCLPVVVEWHLRGPASACGSELPDGLALRVAAELGDCGVMVLWLDGCDPLTRSCCLPIITSAVRAGLLVGPSLHGRGAATERLGDLIRAAPHSVSLQVFSPRAHEHDRIVGEAGAFDRLCRAAGALREAGVRTVLTYLPVTTDADRLLAATELARRLATSAFDLVPAVVDDGVPPSLLLDAAELEDLYRWLGAQGEQLLRPVRLARNKHLGQGPVPYARPPGVTLAKITSSGMLLAGDDGAGAGVDLRDGGFRAAWERLQSLPPRPAGTERPSRPHV